MSDTAGAQRQKADEFWMSTWACALQLTEPGNMPPPPGLAGFALRQAIRATIGGDTLRVRLSNAYGTEPLVIEAARIAVSKGRAAIDAATDACLSFEGRPSVTVPPGGTIASDPLGFEVSPLGDLAVSLRIGSVSPSLTGHPGSRTTSYILNADALGAADPEPLAETDHWYLLCAMDLLVDRSHSAIIALGDSITDGRGSTTNGNDRWTDNLARRLRGDPGARRIAVLNMGLGGNAVLSGGLGPTALERFERDVLGRSGARWLIVLEGVNDIGPGTDPKVAERLIEAYGSMADRARARGIRAYGVPILPFGGSFYDSPEHEAARAAVNEWIRTSGRFDAVIDADEAVRDPANPLRLLPDYDTGDHLHLSPAGYRRIADSIDLRLFE